MKYGPACARCRRLGKRCVAGPEMDEGLQEAAAALQREDRRLRQSIAALEGKVGSLEDQLAARGGVSASDDAEVQELRAQLWRSMLLMRRWRRRVIRRWRT